jgi:hypothetical protein
MQRRFERNSEVDDSSTQELPKTAGNNAGSGHCICSRERRGTNFPFNYAGELVVRNFQIVRGLKIQPKSRAGVEVPSQAQSSIRSNAAALMDDLGNARHWDAQIKRQPIHAQTQRLHELRTQNLAGMNRVVSPR